MDASNIWSFEGGRPALKQKFHEAFEYEVNVYIALSTLEGQKQHHAT